MAWRVALVSLLLCCLAVRSSGAEDIDIGYAEALWSDSTEETDWACWPAPSLYAAAAGCGY